jgi:hypothetical protein
LLGEVLTEDLRRNDSSGRRPEIRTLRTTEQEECHDDSIVFPVLGHERILGIEIRLKGENGASMDDRHDFVRPELLDALAAHQEILTERIGLQITRGDSFSFLFPLPVLTSVYHWSRYISASLRQIGLFQC